MPADDVLDEAVRVASIARNGGTERHAVERWGDELRLALEGLQAAGYSIVQLPEVDRVDPPRSLYDEIVTSGPVQGAFRRGTDGYADELVISTGTQTGYRNTEALRERAAQMLAVAECLDRAATTSETEAAHG